MASGTKGKGWIGGVHFNLPVLMVGLFLRKGKSIFLSLLVAGVDVIGWSSLFAGVDPGVGWHALFAGVDVIGWSSLFAGDDPGVGWYVLFAGVDATGLSSLFAGDDPGVDWYALFPGVDVIGCSSWDGWGTSAIADVVGSLSTSACFVFVKNMI